MTTLNTTSTATVTGTATITCEPWEGRLGDICHQFCTKDKKWNEGVGCVDNPCPNNLGNRNPDTGVCDKPPPPPPPPSIVLCLKGYHLDDNNKCIADAPHSNSNLDCVEGTYDDGSGYCVPIANYVTEDKSDKTVERNYEIASGFSNVFSTPERNGAKPSSKKIPINTYLMYGGGAIVISGIIYFTFIRRR